jgi:hypothetical protein
MNNVIRRRTISPSTRKDTSVNYRIQMTGITRNDTVTVIIDHESKSFKKTYTFRGSDVVKKKSLSFTPIDDGRRIEIVWRSTQPISER